MKRLVILLSTLLMLAGPAYAQWVPPIGGDLVPVTDSAFDLGASGKEWAEIYVDTAVFTTLTLDTLLIDFTAVASGDHAVDINVDTNSLDDIEAIDISYTMADHAADDFENIIEITVLGTGSTGGTLHGLEMSHLGGTFDRIYLVGALAGVGPIHQLSGTFANLDGGQVETAGPAYSNQLAAFNATGTDVAIFVADNDAILIGGTAAFDEIEVLLAVAAANPGIKPVFRYSDGGGDPTIWATFSPSDGTDGFRSSGDIAFEAVDLAGWQSQAINGVNKFWIRIERTANASVSVTEDLFQIAADTEYFWNEFGDGQMRDLQLLGGDLTGLNNVSINVGGNDANEVQFSAAVDALQFNGTSSVAFESIGSGAGDINWTFECTSGGVSHIVLDGDLDINGTGTSNFAGNLQIDGTTTLGDAAGDTLTINTTAINLAAGSTTTITGSSTIGIAATGDFIMKSNTASGGIYLDSKDDIIFRNIDGAPRTGGKIDTDNDRLDWDGDIYGDNLCIEFGGDLNAAAGVYLDIGGTTTNANAGWVAATAGSVVGFSVYANQTIPRCGVAYQVFKNNANVWQLLNSALGHSTVYATTTKGTTTFAAGDIITVFVDGDGQNPGLDATATDIIASVMVTFRD